MKGFITGILFCFAFLTARSQEITYTVLFEYDKYDIPDTSLLNVIKIIQNQNVDRVLLEGHCDNIGSKAYNYTLSDNRALAVKKLLIENGVETKNIKQCIGYGKDRPLTLNETPEERQINRRVLTTFYLKDDKPRVLKDTVPKKTRENEAINALIVKNEPEKRDFLKVEATRINSDIVKNEIGKKDSQYNETSGVKPVIIKSEPEKKDFLKVEATRINSGIVKNEIGKKDSLYNETSGVKPVIIKSEPEKKDFLKVEATRINSGIVKNEIGKKDSLYIETSGVKPVIVKNEPEKKDFLKIEATRIKPVIVQNEIGKKDSLNIETSGVKPVIVKNESAKREFLNVEPTRIKTEIADIADANIGDQIVLENILFEPGRHYLKPESMEDLENLLSVLKGHPTLEIEIQGHVCCTTTEPDGFDWDEETNNLSQTRSQQIYLFLVKNGINRDRLKFKGYGGSHKINQDESTEELRRVNRRVEIKILKK